MKPSKIIGDANIKIDYLNNKRTLTCIIFLADKDIEKLKHFINVAVKDPRDVMFWAKYTNIDAGQSPKKNKRLQQNI